MRASYRTAASAAVVNERVLELERSALGAFLSRLGAAASRAVSPVWRLTCRRPWDSIALTAAAGATCAILINALFLQAAPHPAPMLAGKPRPVATEATGSVVAMPRPRPAGSEAATADPAKADAAAAGRARAQVVADIQRELSRRGFFDGATDGVYGPKTDAAIRDFEQAAGLKTYSQPDETLLRRIAQSAVQAPVQAPPAAQAPSAMPAPRPPAATRASAPSKPAATPSKRVLAVQRALADFGYGQIKPNGILGAETKAAIERFERERKLPVTGQVSDRLTRELAAITGRPLE
jgi:peptidoglycan hydrolase-like protein with peptidoglycan-binding domain